MAQLKNTTINDTGFLQLPVGTTAQRPTPAAGQMRFNTNTGKAEFYNATTAAWLGTQSRSVIATGGNAVYDIDVEGSTYRVHVFTSTGNSTFTTTQGGRAEYLIVAGGGSGGSGEGNPAGDSPGGGGAGGVLTGFIEVTPQAYTVTVGAGASTRVTGVSQNGQNGANSSAFGLTAVGGGAGGREEGPGFGGGSGGGGGGSCTSGRKSGGAGTAGQGFAGGTGGDSGCSRRAGAGGGGAGIAGGDDRGNVGGIGGNGVESSITGFRNFYAGGGGAGNSANQGGAAGAGGLGGGGAGGTSPSGNGTDATPNTGGGGGGTGSGTSILNGLGGTGIVVIRYPLNQENPVVATGRAFNNEAIVDFDFTNGITYPSAGTTVQDVKISGTVGTLINSPVYEDSKTHRASFRFNGSTQHIRLDNFVNRPITQITCESWCFPTRAVTTGTRRGALWSWTSSTYLGIFNSNDGGATHGLHWAVQTSNSRSGSNSGSIPNNQWSYIVGTYDGSRTRGYINGVLVYDVAQTGTLSDGTYYLGVYALGINDVTHNWEGNISDSKLYNRALTQQEILQRYNATRWKFGV